MKIWLVCMDCREKSPNADVELISVEAEDEGLYTMTCQYGHISHTFLQNLKYEVLFDFGCLALMQEFSREAVASFASSIERFHEFCINVFLLKSGIEQKIFNQMWKSVSSQSERQLGAFYFLYLSIFRETPPTFILHPKTAKFRNSVIHKGYIPKREEALQYGEQVFEYINKVSQKLKTTLLTYVGQARGAYITSLQQRIDFKKYAIMTIPTILDMTRDYEEKTFSSAFLRLKQHKTFFS